MDPQHHRQPGGSFRHFSLSEAWRVHVQVQAVFPAQGSGGSGARQRSAPTGGLAKGMPSHAWLLLSTWKPTIVPLCITRREAVSGFRCSPRAQPGAPTVITINNVTKRLCSEIFRCDIKPPNLLLIKIAKEHHRTGRDRDDTTRFYLDAAISLVAG
jgi:hypothetical protein